MLLKTMISSWRKAFRNPEMPFVMIQLLSLIHIYMADLKSQAEAHKDNLSCIMVTYPSTHGVYEPVSYTHLDVYKRQPYKCPSAIGI